MGTHARGPSQVKEGEARIPLADYFKDHPDVLGQHEKDGTGLQFLLKVLSVGKCLSLQLHPTKVWLLFVDENLYSLLIGASQRTACR